MKKFVKSMGFLEERSNNFNRDIRKIEEDIKSADTEISYLRKEIGNSN